MIVPYPAGGTTDFSAVWLPMGSRPALAPPSSSRTSRSRDHAWRDQVARAEPDGYTLLMATSPRLPSTDALTRNCLRPGQGFYAVALVRGAFALIINPQVPAKTLPEFIAYAKSTPGLAYGSAGNGSPQHLGAEMLKAAAAIDIRHVPYRGSVRRCLMIAGHIPFMVVDCSRLAADSRGKVRVLVSPRPNGLPPHRTSRPWPKGVYRLRTGRVAGGRRARRRAAADHRPVGRANRKADGRSRNARQAHHDCAGATAGSTPDSFAAYIKTESIAGRDRQEFGRGAGMTNVCPRRSSPYQA